MEGIGGVIRRRSDQARKKQETPPGQLPGIGRPAERKEKYIHSPAHALAAEMSAYFGEKKKFAVYLSVIRRIGMAQARTIFSSIKSDDANIRNPRKFFMWLTKSSEEGARPKKPAKPRGARKKRPGKQLDFGDLLG